MGAKREFDWYQPSRLLPNFTFDSGFARWEKRVADNYGKQLKLLVPFKGNSNIGDSLCVSFEEIGATDIITEMAKAQQIVYQSVGYIVPVKNRQDIEALAKEYLLNTSLCLVIHLKRDNTSEAFLATKSNDILEAYGDLSNKPKNTRELIEVPLHDGTTPIARISRLPDRSMQFNKRQLNLHSKTINIIPLFLLGVFYDNLYGRLIQSQDKLWVTYFDELSQKQIGFTTSLNGKTLFSACNNDNLVRKVICFSKQKPFENLVLPSIEDNLELVQFPVSNLVSVHSV